MACPFRSTILRTRQQFAGNILPTGRLSPQAQRLLQLDPSAERTGRERGTRDNFVVGGSEGFDDDTFNVRIDGRLTDKLNMFGRYSFARLVRNGPTAFGQGGGPELVTLGGISKVRNQSIANGFDYSFRHDDGRLPLRLLPLQGQCVAVRLRDTPAADVGIPGLNLD